MPQLVRIAIFPVKSLDPLLARTARIVEPGALEHDREFAIVDAAGQWVNGKRTAQIHRLRATFSPDAQSVGIGLDAGPAERQFRLDGDRVALEGFLSEFFGEPVRLEHNARGGFPDDAVLSGPTIVSTATLEAVAGWFAGLSIDELRLRFRANLEIGGVPPFWEDQFFAGEGEAVPLAIGDVVLQGANPCQRCVVPTRDPQSGEEISGFQKTFATRREETLPDWAPRARFTHFYRLAVNTRIEPGQWGRQLNVGDEVRLLRNATLYAAQPGDLPATSAGS